MTVDPEITKQVMRNELAEANLDQIDIELETDYDNLTITVTMTSPVDGEVYIAEFDCTDYRENPPSIQMIHPETGERDVPSAYFDDGDNLIATSNDGVVICIGFNRQVIEHEGIHKNWSLAGWEQNAKGHTRLGDMIGRLYLAIADEQQYNGRHA